MTMMDDREHRLATNQRKKLVNRHHVQFFIRLVIALISAHLISQALPVTHGTPQRKTRLPKTTRTKG